MSNLKLNIMYSLNEQQQQKLDELKTQLTEDAFNILTAKVEKLKTFANAEERINKLIYKDIATLKRVISAEKSKAKKVEIEEIDTEKYIAEICNMVKTFDYNDVCILIEKLETIRENNKKRYINELDRKIIKAKEELKALEELKNNM